MKFSNSKASTTRLFVALVLAVACVVGLNSTVDAATCYTCHAPVGSGTDIRPVESTYRNISTGGFPGSHTKHMQTAVPAANASTCNGCHGSTVTLTKHRDGQVAVPAVGYSKGATFAQGTAGVGTCTTASCHDTGLGLSGAAAPIESPVWGTAAAACAICHPASPITGSHPEHFQDSAISCASCHNGYNVQTQAVNATQHIDGNIDVFKTASADLGYTANKTKGTAYTTCNNASCHKNPSITVAGPNFTQLTTPAWGLFPSPARCTSCHASRPVTGSHQAHYDAGFSLCTNCHAGAVESATAPTAGHLDGNINVTGYFTPSKAPAFPASSTYTYCASATCHNDGRGGQVNSPVWGVANNDCSACHLKRPTTGTHTAHMTIGLTCNACHAGAVEGTSAPLQHLDGNIDVYNTTPGDIGITADKAINSAFTTCNNTTCHSIAAVGAGSPNWSTGTTANVQCTKCHGKPVTANYSTTTHVQSAPGYSNTATNFGRNLGVVSSGVSPDAKAGSHDTHLRALANIGKPALCTDCHVVPATVFGPGHRDGNSTPVFSNMVKNIETVPASGIPYTFAQGTKAATYNPATGACSNTYCHGATLPGGTDTAPVWNVGTYISSNNNRALDCTKCHGFPPQTGSSLYNHSAGDTTCTLCHPHNGYRTSTDPLLGGDTHMNGKIEANKHCDSCHDYDTRGGGTVWGRNQIAIEGYGAHAAHITYLKKRMNITTMDANLDIFGTANFKGICGVCHTRLESNHTQGDRSGVSAAAKRNITFGDASAVKRQFGISAPSYGGVTGVSSGTTLKTCSNVDCHYKTSPIWQSY